MSLPKRIIGQAVVWAFFILINSSVAFGEPKHFTGVGECQIGDIATTEQARAFAGELALQDAERKAVDYLRGLPEASDHPASDNEYWLSVNNAIVPTGEIVYLELPLRIGDRAVTKYTATVEIALDDESDNFALADGRRLAILFARNEPTAAYLTRSLREIMILERKSAAAPERERDKYKREFHKLYQGLLAAQKTDDAMLCICNRNYERALIMLNDAAGIAPNYADVYNCLGGIYTLMKGRANYDRALSLYDRSLTLKPDYVYAYVNRSLVYSDREDYSSAIRDLTAAIKLDPQCAEAYKLRGANYGLQNDCDNALADIRRAAQLDPKDKETQELIFSLS